MNSKEVNMIVNAFQTAQQRVQEKQQDREQTNKYTQDFQDQLLAKGIKTSDVQANRLIIRITDNINIYQSIIAVHCPSEPHHKFLPGVTTENREKYHVDIDLCYDPSTGIPEGFALRNQLEFRSDAMPNKENPGEPLWTIERKKLDPDINKLFALNYLLQNSQPEPNPQSEPISYV